MHLISMYGPKWIQICSKKTDYRIQKIRKVAPALLISWYNGYILFYLSICFIRCVMFCFDWFIEVFFIHLFFSFQFSIIPFLLYFISFYSLSNNYILKSLDQFSPIFELTESLLGMICFVYLSIVKNTCAV